MTVPLPNEYVALSAARQAALALAGTPEPPEWPVATSETIETVDEKESDEIRGAYAEVRRATHGI